MYPHRVVHVQSAPTTQHPTTIVGNDTAYHTVAQQPSYKIPHNEMHES